MIGKTKGHPLTATPGRRERFAKWIDTRDRPGLDGRTRRVELIDLSTFLAAEALGEGDDAEAVVWVQLGQVLATTIYH